ncbi:DUF3899 domain-containing protein [Macrococcus equi]|uniref:DUF3899 domain-containing protein n=1 Tax=Macrococcus equi TaxID=3395462 RepID=UPI0039BE915B
MNKYIIILLIEFVLSLIFTIFTGFDFYNIINGIFIISITGLCIGLLMKIYGDGAFSIMGHSFRKFNYIMSPKRIKKTMDADPSFNKELRIRHENYIWTYPILFSSLGLLIFSMLISMI